MTRQELYKIREQYIHDKVDYKMIYWDKFDYNILHNIMYICRSGRGDNSSVNDIIIMADTETSKKKIGVNSENHVCAWTISMRAFNKNIATLYGAKPSDMIKCIDMIHSNMSGQQTFFYFHNLSYDWVFLRAFMFNQFGYPSKQLNTKAHYPIYLQWGNGVIFRDSLILAQRNLDKWAKDLDVEHKKAVGKWDYDLIRNQNNVSFTEDELLYIENDTLAGVECLQKTIDNLHKSIFSIPYTATGIPREQVRKLAKENNGKQNYNKLVATFDQYIKLTHCFHGGFTHGNRHFIDATISIATGLLEQDEFVQARDFASSYPFVMLAEKYPIEAFFKTIDCTLDYIIKNSDNYAYMFKLIAIRPHLKEHDNPMPALQFSKCIHTVNAIIDNGRILAADYIEIYLCDPDAEVIFEQYEFDKHWCVEVETAMKGYLPRWFTDYIFECFTKKTMLKGGNPVDYSIAKATVNSLYGLTVMRNIREDIEEDFETGDYIKPPQDEKEVYERYIKNHNTVLPYQWGVWVTSYAFRNIHRLIKCCELPLYCDTDSCYGVNWDYDAVAIYNNSCKEKLKANNYSCVVRGNREYWLGVAETEGNNDIYDEFRVMGAKRYCGRNRADGEIHITVAGVPKKGAICLDNNIDNFTKGFIFSGTKTGKLLHTYYYNDIYIDENGNETGDSISLDPCDYRLDAVTVVDWESLFYEEVEVQVYE